MLASPPCRTLHTGEGSRPPGSESLLNLDGLARCGSPPCRPLSPATSNIFDAGAMEGKVVTHITPRKDPRCVCLRMLHAGNLNPLSIRDLAALPLTGGGPNPHVYSSVLVVPNTTRTSPTPTSLLAATLHHRLEHGAGRGHGRRCSRRERMTCTFLSRR
jgi:hypothetical protein